VLSAEHTEQGTLLKARVGPELAAALRAYPSRDPGGRAAGRIGPPAWFRPDQLPVQLRTIYDGPMGSL
jgi:hypothetical protein